MSTRRTFAIPRDPHQADRLAGDLGVLATATEWKRAAIVYSRVRVQEGQGRPIAAEKAKTDLLSPAEYALLGIHGLRSTTTVRAYWRAWDNAVTEGLAEPVKLGDQVTVPSAEWADYYSITPDCPPWANTSRPPFESEPTHPQPSGGDTTAERRDGLGLGNCSPRATPTPDSRPEPQPNRSLKLDDYFTPPHIIGAARRAMGGIDTDPATHHIAQQYIDAHHAYTIQDDGLTQPWHGKVWLNPPFGQWDEWVPKILSELESDRVTDICVLMPCRAMSGLGIADLIDAADALWISKGRLQFGGLGGTANDGSAIAYLGPHRVEFVREFLSLGAVKVSVK
jgi:DNA N-6-adenine-methyltransferase (Dam)